MKRRTMPLKRRCLEKDTID